MFAADDKRLFAAARLSRGLFGMFGTPLARFFEISGTGGSRAGAVLSTLCCLVGALDVSCCGGNRWIDERGVLGTSDPRSRPAGDVLRPYGNRLPSHPGFVALAGLAVRPRIIARVTPPTFVGV